MVTDRTGKAASAALGSPAKNAPRCSNLARAESGLRSTLTVGGGAEGPLRGRDHDARRVRALARTQKDHPAAPDCTGVANVSLTYTSLAKVGA